jgi:phosphoribosyl 1,2-cyclic phosphodiesterase
MSRASFSVCVAASGSTGNCTIVRHGDDVLIVDCGISRKRVLASLAEQNIAPGQVRGIVLTHEHRDHCAGVGALSRGLQVPVYATAGTLAEAKDILKETAGQGVVDERTPFVIGSIRVEPFPTFHDAANPFAVVMRPAVGDGAALAVVTDLGFVSTLAYERLKGVRTAVFETNYDFGMLQDGPYPWHLKQRIAGRQGHLDNVATARALTTLYGAGLRQVLLAHLSETNNTPDTVMQTLKSRLPADVYDGTRFYLTYPDRPSQVVEV